jgi:hypothetical protein
MLRAVSGAPYDVLIAPPEQVGSLLAWLKTCAEPVKEEAVLLTESEMMSVNRLHPSATGFAWCGYAWKSSCPILGQMLVTLGMTFPDLSICSLGLLVACWRQIACAIEGVLVC